MRIRKRFLFDEKSEAEKIIKEGFLEGKIDYGDIYLVAKYFRQEYNLGEIRLERKLIEFCKKYDKNFNPITNKNIIKKWVKSAINYNLREIHEIEISENDINFLKNIESPRDRKLLFMAIVFSKALRNSSTKKKKSKQKNSNKYYLRYNNFKDIIRMSELSNISEVGFSKILYKYKNSLTFYNPEKELIRLDFIDETCDKKIKIGNLDTPLKSYYKIFGENMSYCEICKKEIYKKSNRQRVCEECSKELARKRTEKWRNKSL